jgi:hypothetical protein
MSRFSIPDLARIDPAAQRRHITIPDPKGQTFKLAAPPKKPLDKIG